MIHHYEGLLVIRNLLGRMMVTWLRRSANKFIEVSRQRFEAGVSILHFLNDISSAEIIGRRAITQTTMTVNQCALADITVLGHLSAGGDPLAIALFQPCDMCL